MALITDKQMQAKAGAKDAWLFEPFPRGQGSFCGRITPKGERLFYYRYTAPGRKQVWLPLGAYSRNGKDGLTLAEARDKAQELAGKYRAGAKDLKEHLQTEEAQRKQEAEEAAKAKDRRKTFRQVFDQWLLTLKPTVDSNGKRHGRKDAGAYTKQQFTRRVFGTLGDVPIEDVTKPDLLKILGDAKADGKMRTANVLLADLKQMFRFALAWEYIEKDPMATVDKKRDAGGDDVERDRCLTDEEIEALVKQLPNANLAERSRLGLYVILSTGCRIGELVSAKWEDVHISDDNKQRHWYLPETKNQRDHTIYLSDFALTQFRALKALCQTDEDDPNKIAPWVFPNRKGDGHLDIKTLGKQFADRQRPEGKKQLKRRSTKNMTLALNGGRWTAHDLRRTAATIMARLGVSTDVIDECLNHKIEKRVSRVYIQSRREPEQQRAFIKLGDHLNSLVNGKKTGVVIELTAA
jgi:integrase